MMEFFIVIIVTFVILGMINPNVFKSWDKIREERREESISGNIYRDRPTDFPKLELGKDWEYYENFPGSAMSFERHMELHNSGNHCWDNMYRSERDVVQKLLKEALLLDSSDDKKIFHGECIGCVAQDIKGIKNCFKCRYFTHNSFGISDRSIKLKVE